MLTPFGKQLEGFKLALSCQEIWKKSKIFPKLKEIFGKAIKPVGKYLGKPLVFQTTLLLIKRMSWSVDLQGRMP